jgi:predicted kinase
MLIEGQHNKATLKFVFLAGGPGSGKNFVAQQLFNMGKNSSFSADGMKLISFDNIFENELRVRGYDPAELNNLTPNEEWGLMSEANPHSVYRRCRDLVKQQLKHHIKQGDGIIFDGTGRDANSYFRKKDDAAYLGYDTFMVFVDTSVQKALERNAKRSRKLPDELVARHTRSVGYNKKAFEKDFGKNMLVINNDQDNAPLPPEAYQFARRVINEPVQNLKGKYFLKTGKRPWLTAPKPKLPKDIVPTKPSEKPGENPNKTSSWGWANYLKYHPQDKDVPSTTQQPTEPVKTYSYSPPKYDPKQLSMWDTFKQKQAEKPNNPKKDAHHSIDNTRIHNPETGNDILLKTALGYPPGHPMRTAADAKLKELQGGTNNNPPQQ